jgi:tripartite-type tricarboxylate transporter receptor subunit TctC
MLAIVRAVTACVALAAATICAAQSTDSYPQRPVRMVVGYATGGGADALARVVASKLSAVLGQQVIVDNRPGAGATIAADLVAKAPPDGYTLYFADTAILIAPSVYSSLPYDPAKSFTPIGRVALLPLVFVVNPSLPATNASELVAVLKANPGKYSYGSSGVGTLGHLAFELLKLRAGVDIVHIPYKGAAPIVTDLLGNQIQLAVMSVTAAIPQTKAGKLRAIALSSPVQLSAVPDWRPLSDTLPGFDASSRLFLIAPAGTPTAIVRKLNRALEQVLAEPEVLESFAKNGAPAAWSTPEALATEMAEETQRWGSIARSSGAKLE